MNRSHVANRLPQLPFSSDGPRSVILGGEATLWSERAWRETSWSQNRWTRNGGGSAWDGGSGLAWECPPSIRRLFRAIVSRAYAIPFAVLMLFIAAVSVHDAALVAVNSDVIAEMEQNPIGRWLIEWNAGSVTLFIGVKLLGTSLVCAFLASLYEYSRRVGMAVTLPLAVFQACLLTYLYTH